MTSNKLIAYEIPFKLRRAVPKKKSLEVTFPYAVAEKEAGSLGITVEELMAQYDLVCQYNGFPGVRYIFRKRGDAS